MHLFEMVNQLLTHVFRGQGFEKKVTTSENCWTVLVKTNSFCLYHSIM